jgi:hypothetical protein
LKKSSAILPRGGIDQPAADLRQLAADLGIDVVDELRLAIDVLQPHFGPALGEAGCAAGALARDEIALRRVELAQPHVAGEIGLHRTDLCHDLGGELGGRMLDHLLAARNRLPQHLGIVQRLPDPRLRGRNDLFAAHLHVTTSRRM